MYYFLVLNHDRVRTVEHCIVFVFSLQNDIHKFLLLATLIWNQNFIAVELILNREISTKK